MKPRRAKALVQKKLASAASAGRRAAAPPPAASPKKIVKKTLVPPTASAASSKKSPAKEVKQTLEKKTERSVSPRKGRAGQEEHEAPVLEGTFHNIFLCHNWMALAIIVDVISEIVLPPASRRGPRGRPVEESPKKTIAPPVEKQSECVSSHM